MSENRRGFLLSGPAAALGLSGWASALAQTPRAGTRVAADVADFWVTGMGVPAEMVLGGEKTRGRTPAAGPGNLAGYAREPLFLHYDADDKVLIAADQIPVERLVASGDTKVDFQMMRLRLNPGDTQQFRNYSSGGIYLDFQQQQTQSPPLSDSLLSLASSIFSAIFPAKAKPDSGSGGKGTGTGSSSGGKGKAFFQSSFQTSGASKSSGSAPPSSIPLQQASQSQSLSLPGGTGKTAFACFAKDRKKSAFGQFVDAMSQIADPAASYVSLLPLQLIASPALTTIRALVANLQTQGGNQQWIMQSPPSDVSATADGCKTLPTAIRLRPGYYVAIPKEHASAIKDQLGKLKILDGFLVPKEATELDVFDLVDQTVPQVSYVSLSINVTKTVKASSCVAEKQA